MSLEKNVETIRSLFAYFNTGNVPGLLSIVTDDFVLEDIGLGKTWTGKQGWGEWLQNWAVGLPDAHTELGRIIAQNDLVMAEHVGSGTQNGPLNTPVGVVAPTGRPTRLEWAEVFTMQDGKIKTMRAYWDTGTLMRQLGLVSA